MSEAVTVNVDNFARAESNLAFAATQKEAGDVNTWSHNRVPTPFDRQPVIRQNRDTLYSAAVVNVSEGATITIPDAGDRYLSAMVIDQDHYVPHIFHGGGTHELALAESGTEFVLVVVRILVDPNDADDLAAVNRLQDELVIDARAGAAFVLPPYDLDAMKDTRAHLIGLSRGIGDFHGAFGRRGEVDEIRHLLGSASGWGGFPESEAVYLNVDPGLPRGDYELTVGDVPVDAFWSITVYNADGYMVDNPAHTVSVNSVTAVRDDDGTVTVRFGDSTAPNTIPITEGWNYLVRLYRPRQEVQSGDYRFPEIVRL